MDASPRNVLVRTLEQRESTILVVDDEAANRDLMSSLLSSQGYRVRLASDGASAIQLVEEGGIDLVLLDLMMSRMDGVEVCTHLRKCPRSDLLPIVFTTSLHDRASRIRAKEAGADDFLVKPIDGLELLVRVEHLLRVRASHELLYTERDRLTRELAKARAQLVLADPGAQSAPPANGLSLPPLHGGSAPASGGDELAREHRRRLSELVRTCTSEELRGPLQELLREAEELERRSAASTTSFPLLHTRSTL